MDWSTQPAAVLWVDISRMEGKGMADPISLVLFSPQSAILGVIQSGREWIKGLREEMDKETALAAGGREKAVTGKSVCTNMIAISAGGLAVMNKGCSRCFCTSS
jgi:hypothetical protein